MINKNVHLKAIITLHHLRRNKEFFFRSEQRISKVQPCSASAE